MYIMYVICLDVLMYIYVFEWGTVSWGMQVVVSLDQESGCLDWGPDPDMEPGYAKAQAETSPSFMLDHVFF